MVCIRQVIKEVEKARGHPGVRMEHILEYLEVRLSRAVQKGILKKRGHKFNLAKSCRSGVSNNGNMEVRRASKKEIAYRKPSKKESLIRRTCRKEPCVQKRCRAVNDVVETNKTGKQNKRETRKKKVRFQQPQEQRSDAIISRTRRCRTRGRYNFRRNPKCPNSFQEIGANSGKVKNIKILTCNVPSKSKVHQRKRISNQVECEASTSKKGRPNLKDQRKNCTSTSKEEEEVSQNQEDRQVTPRRERSLTKPPSKRLPLAANRQEYCISTFKGDVPTTNKEQRGASPKRDRSPSKVSKKRSSSGLDSDDESHVSESQSKLLSTRDSLEVLKERISRKSLDLESAGVSPQAPCPEPRAPCVDITTSSTAVPEKCPGVVMFNPGQQSCSSKSLFSVFSWPQKQ